MEKSEKKKFLKLIEKGKLELKDLSSDYRNDKDIIKEFLKVTWFKSSDTEKHFEYVSDELKHDFSFVKECLEINGDIFKFVSDDLKSNREICLIAIGKKGYNFKYCKNKDIKERDFLIESVSLAGSSLYFMDDVIKDDFEIAKIAVNQDGSAFSDLSERLRNNKELLTDSIKQQKRGYYLQYASIELKSDESLMVELLDYESKVCWILQNAADNIKSNKKVVLKAVSLDGRNLEYAAEELQNDKEVVYAAVFNDNSSIQYASEEIINDLNFYEILTQIQGINIQNLNYYILNNSVKKKLSRNLIRKMIEKNVESFERLNNEFKSDEEIIYLALSISSSPSKIVKHIIPNENTFLDYLILLNKQNPLGNYKTELLTSKERLLMAIHVYYVPTYPGLFKSIPDELKNDIDVQSLIMEKSK